MLKSIINKVITQGDALSLLRDTPRVTIPKLQSWVSDLPKPGHCHCACVSRSSFALLIGSPGQASVTDRNAWEHRLLTGMRGA